MKRSVRSHGWITHQNGTLRRQGLRTLYAPRYCHPFDRSQLAHAKETRAARIRQRNINGSSTKRQRNVNQASTKHQPSVNGTSTGHQPNVNGTSNRRLSRRELRRRFLADHPRTAQRGLVDQSAVSEYAGRATLSGPDHQMRGHEIFRAARTPCLRRTECVSCERSGAIGRQVGRVSCERNGAIGRQVGCVPAIRAPFGIKGGQNDDKEDERNHAERSRSRLTLRTAWLPRYSVRGAPRDVMTANKHLCGGKDHPASRSSR